MSEQQTEPSLDALQARRDALEAEREDIEEELHRWKTVADALGQKIMAKKFLNAQEREQQLEAKRRIRELSMDHQSLLRDLGQANRQLRVIERPLRSEREGGWDYKFRVAAKELLTGKQYNEIVERTHELMDEEHP